MSLVYFFDFATVTTSTVTGWCVTISFLLSSIAGAGYMYLVERAKKCLDFSATLYIIHLFICIMYGGWPSSITWWVVNVIGVAVMALLGEFLCIRWDPWLIVAQIVCLQCLYYLTLGVFLSFLVGTRVSRMSLVYFFDFATVTTSTVTGWCVTVSFLLSSIAGAGYMLYLVERAKKCLDFSATLYIIHLFICIMYGGWPSSITWWVVNVTGVAVMALLEHGMNQFVLIPGICVFVTLFVYWSTVLLFSKSFLC
ncbi:hypothetical protein GQ457_14G006010 [Hibiscus cannabinus]